MCIVSRNDNFQVDQISSFATLLLITTILWRIKIWVWHLKAKKTLHNTAHCDTVTPTVLVWLYPNLPHIFLWAIIGLFYWLTAKSMKEKARHILSTCCLDWEVDSHIKQAASQNLYVISLIVSIKASSLSCFIEHSFCLINDGLQRGVSQGATQRLPGATGDWRCV